MDQIDQKILELIRENARMSYSDIGKAVGISRVSAKKRMDSMEKAGVIGGYHTVIDEEKARGGLRSRNQSTMESHVTYLFNHTKGIRKISWHILLSDLRQAEEGDGYGTEKEKLQGV